MKKLLIGSCFILCALVIKAQNLDRVSLTSGGLVNNKMDVVIGELFVFTFDQGKGQSLETGSLGSITNTGGINLQATGIATTKAQHKVLCYPNPVKEQLTFSVDNMKNTLVIIQIVNLTGKIIMQTRSDSPEYTKLDVSGLKPGQYILELKTSNNMDIPSFKFIKQ
jgi:hypothetical protein